MGALLLLLPDPSSLSQNLRGWLHHGLELPCLSQWGPCLSHPPASLPSPVSPVPPPLPPTPTCSHVVDSSLPLPSHPPLLNTYPLSAFTLPSTPPPPTSTQPTNNSPPHPHRTPCPLKTLEFFNEMPAVFPPHVFPHSRRAELIAFLSNNHIHSYPLWPGLLSCFRLLPFFPGPLLRLHLC